MKISRFLSVAAALFRARFLGEKIPLIVSWALTFRCDSRCLNCRSWELQSDELPTADVVSRIHEFADLGTKWMSFTGGEPLLREDIGEIVGAAKARGISVNVSSNGRLVLEKLNQIKDIDGLHLSLDGPPPINDRIRGVGSYEAAIRAIDICQKSGVSVSLVCVLCKYNLESVDWVVDFAAGRELNVLFQPAVDELLWSSTPNPFVAPVDRYREVMTHLMRRKEAGAPIDNSVTGLRYLRHWPDRYHLPCNAGALFFNVAPDGAILTCDRVQKRLIGALSGKLRIKDMLEKVPPVSDCAGCWPASLVEFNLITSLKSDAIANHFKTARNPVQGP